MDNGFLRAVPLDAQDELGTLWCTTSKTDSKKNVVDKVVVWNSYNNMSGKHDRVKKKVVNRIDNRGFPPLWQAVDFKQFAHHRSFTLTQKYGCIPNSSRTGAHLLHLAVHMSYFDIIKRLAGRREKDGPYLAIASKSPMGSYSP